jgi:cytochrome c-type biogenesis protein CcmE
MNRVRRTRLIAVVFLVAGAATTVALVLRALNDNLNMFYAPDQVVGGDAPHDTVIRAGGMVEGGSVRREPDSLAVQFVVSDLQGASFPVHYEKILPDLFRECQGVMVRGKLHADGVFYAEEVLAKHDENYMPPELADMHLAKTACAPAGAPREGGTPAAAAPGLEARR